MSEKHIQNAIIAFLKAALPSDYRWFHLNNTPRNAVHGAQLKRMGLVKGMPDICIVRAGGSIAFLEVKAPQGTLSNSQKEFRDWCGEHLVPFAVVRGIGDVEAVLLDWNVPLKARAGA